MADKKSWKDDPGYANLAHGVDERGLTAEEEADQREKSTKSRNREAVREQRDTEKAAATKEASS